MPSYFVVVRSCRSPCDMVCLEFPKATYHEKVVVHPLSACYRSSWRSLHRLPTAQTWSTNLFWVVLPCMHVSAVCDETFPHKLNRSERKLWRWFHSLLSPDAAACSYSNLIGGNSMFDTTQGWFSSCVSKHCSQCSADTSMHLGNLRLSVPNPLINAFHCSLDLVWW